MKHDCASIVKLLDSNDLAVDRAIAAIYNRQTYDERKIGKTTVRNGVGFSGAHARLGTYYAKWVLSGKRLSGNHLAKARVIAKHYAGQLAAIANSRMQSDDSVTTI